MNNENYENYLTTTNEGLDINAHNIETECITSSKNKFSLDNDGNLTVNSINFNNSKNNILSFDAIFDKIYPVGAIYISTYNTNPGNLFTGSWEKIEGKFLLASGTNYQLGKTGGEEKHTLTINEMPYHGHELNVYNSNWTNTVPSDIDTAQYGKWTSKGIRATGYPVKAVGGNQAHNNMPPYLVVNIWKRIS